MSRKLKTQRPQQRWQEEEQDERQPTPFGRALYLCRLVASREDDQSEAQEAVRALPDQDQKSLVFRLAGECLRMKAEIPAVFAAAYAARMMPVAHATASIRKAMRAGGLGLADLVRVGLVEVKTQTFTKTVGGGEKQEFSREWLVPHLGNKAIRAAANALNKEGNYAAAKELERHLAYAEERKLKSEARRERQAKATSESEE